MLDNLLAKSKNFLNFFMASGFGTTFDFVIFNLLVLSGMQPIFSNSLSFFAGSIAAFAVLTWRRKRFISRLSYGKSLAGYVILGSASLGLSSLTIHLVAEMTDSLLVINLSKLMAVGVLFIAKYVVSLIFLLKPAHDGHQS